jgi:tetratricopeptide (TPR) repeat protein
VVVRTLKLGHFFPGGTVDAYDCWLELKATDNKGHVIFWSGEAADGGKGPVDPSAHFYRSLQLDAHGNNVNKRNTWLTRAVVYARLIPPGAADTVHYRLKVPDDCGDRITLTAKLNYRKFSWWYTHWAFAGVRDPKDPRYGRSYNFDDGRWVFTGSLADVSAKLKEIPDIPTVVIARQSITLPVESTENPGAAVSFAQDIGRERKDLVRWNDYGIGLLLQGDLKGAERAFRIVTEINPAYADGWVNIARAMIQEGDTDASKPLLLKALKLNPKLGSARYFYGLAIKADGSYPAAYKQFALAAARYPYDRVVRNQMGRMLFLERRYSQALQEFRKTLSIDPEDLEAHYNMMLCYMGLDKPALAGHEEKLYLRFKANEIARSITGPYRLTRPWDNNESLPVHEHASVPLDEINRPPAYWYSPYQNSLTPRSLAATRSMRRSAGILPALTRDPGAPGPPSGPPRRRRYKPETVPLPSRGGSVFY